MEQKEEALRQLETIRQAVLDRSRIIPDAPTHYFVWAVLSAVGFLRAYWIDGVAASAGIAAPTVLALYLGIMLIVGFGTTWFIIGRSLHQNDLICSKDLRLIGHTYLFSFLFATLTALNLQGSEAAALIDGVWLFCVGVAMHVEHTIANRIYGGYGLLLMATALLYLAAGYILPDGIHALLPLGSVLGLGMISIALVVFGLRLRMSGAYV